MDDLVVSALADVLLVEAELRQQLLPLDPSDEGGGVHHAAVADHQAVLRRDNSLGHNLSRSQCYEKFHRPILTSL